MPHKEMVKLIPHRFQKKEEKNHGKKETRKESTCEKCEKCENEINQSFSPAGRKKDCNQSSLFCLTIYIKWGILKLIKRR